jgi:hypothetical protein
MGFPYRIYAANWKRFLGFASAERFCPWGQFRARHKIQRGQLRATLKLRGWREISRIPRRGASLRANSKVNDKLAIGSTVVGVALSFYWMFTFSGPYRFLAELQTKWFGWYVPKLTMFAIVMAIVGLVLAVRKIVQGAEQPVPNAASALAPTPNASGTQLHVPVWYASPYSRLLLLVLPFGLGLYSFLNASRAGELRHLQAADFGNGNVTQRVIYADVSGELGRDYVSDDNYMYIPMRTSESSNEPVSVVVGVSKNKVAQYLQPRPGGGVIVQGMTERNLNAEVKVALEKGGVTLAENVWVVHTGRNPQSDMKFGMWLMIGTVPFGAGLLFLVKYRARLQFGKRPRQAPAQASAYGATPNPS